MTTSGKQPSPRDWVAIGVSLLAMAGAVFASAKDTPTREEMERKDAALEYRMTRLLQEAVQDRNRRLERIEDKVDRIIQEQEHGGGR